MKNIPVVILCGGKGMRLGELTGDVPKPLIRIGDRPILWHVMKIYASQGCRHFILCLGYKHDEIRKYFHENNTEGWKIDLVDTGLDTSKSERICQIRELIKTDEFFLAYGDDVADIRLDKLLARHRKLDHVCTLTIVRLVSDFGIVVTDTKTGSITAFKEKPVLSEWMNGGFMVMKARIFDYLDRGELEQEVFNALVEDKEIGAYEHPGQWKAMNTLKDYNDLTTIWRTRKAFWKTWEGAES